MGGLLEVSAKAGNRHMSHGRVKHFRCVWLVSLLLVACLMLTGAAHGVVLDFLVPMTFGFLLATTVHCYRPSSKAERDVTDGRQIEIERSRQIFDAISDMIILKGEGSRLLWGNKAFRDYYGMSNEQLQGLVDAPHVEPDLTQKYVVDDLRVLETGEPLVIEEEQAARFDGCMRWFNTIKTPIKDRSNKAIMLVAVCRDITAQRDSERIIAEQKSQMMASSKLSSLGEMAAGLAHEINNPLAIISGRASNLRRLVERNPENIEMISRFATDIEATTHRIAKIIRGLRAFARNGEEDPFVTCSLGDIVDDTLALCAARLQDRGVRIDIADVSKSLTLECRPVQVSQVLLNLLANAFDAIEDLPERWINIASYRRAEGVEIVVTDSGAGIPESTLEKIFQPFFTTKAVGKGTGLGLSVTRGIVDQHHGRISVDTASKHTRFIVWLPERQPDNAVV